MPTKKLVKPCAYPGCPTLHRGGLYCAKHIKKVGGIRAKTAEMGYGGEWRKARAKFLRAHPYCVCADCKAAGRRRATVVDHIIPHRGDMTLFWDQTNWQAMASPCHNKKTFREDGGFRGRGHE